MDGTVFDVEVMNGAFGGVTLGLFLNPGSMPFRLHNPRFEASFGLSGFDDDTVTTATGGVRDVDGVPGVFAALPATSRQKRETFDGSIALKGEVRHGADGDLTVALESFIRNSDDETLSKCCPAGGIRSADINSWFYGLMLAVQPEVSLGARLSLVADLGAGVYLVDGDGKFSSTPVVVTTTISDNKQKLGFRGRAMIGLKLAHEAGVTTTLFGGIDYWNNVPFANMPSIATGNFLSHVGFDQLIELKAGARVTIPFAGVN
ncbi:MAG: hypothetical protein O7G83_12670 [Proteobacteria bacterium]|nr:hypothetical protein [Pseudomonadota bacterium]